MLATDVVARSPRVISPGTAEVYVRFTLGDRFLAGTVTVRRLRSGRVLAQLGAGIVSDLRRLSVASGDVSRTAIERAACAAAFPGAKPVDFS